MHWGIKQDRATPLLSPLNINISFYYHSSFSGYFSDPCVYSGCAGPSTSPGASHCSSHRLIFTAAFASLSPKGLIWQPVPGKYTQDRLISENKHLQIGL